MIHGAPKAGKSYLIIDLVTAIASGEPEWLGFPVHTAGPVLYLQLDTPRQEWQARTIAIQESGRDNTAVITADRLICPGFDILNAAHAAWLRSCVDHLQPVCIVIDTLRRSFRGKEGESDVVDMVLGQFELACAPAAIILVHHSRKSNPNPNVAKEDREDPMDNLRGSSAWGGQMDTVMFLNGRKLLYEGRSIADGHVKLRRLPNLLWGLDEDPIDVTARVLLSRPGSMLARARALTEAHPGVSLEAARTRLRRLLGGGQEVGGGQNA
jgi:RecA-family ATPase